MSEKTSGGRTTVDGGRLSFASTTMAALARRLSELLREPVIDATGLDGVYDFSLQWQQDDTGVGPSLFTAVEDQLGLKLEHRRLPIDILVIEHAEGTPVEN